MQKSNIYIFFFFAPLRWCFNNVLDFFFHSRPTRVAAMKVTLISEYCNDFQRLKGQNSRLYIFSPTSTIQRQIRVEATKTTKRKNTNNNKPSDVRHVLMFDATENYYRERKSRFRKIIKIQKKQILYMRRVHGNNPSKYSQLKCF